MLYNNNQKNSFLQKLILFITTPVILLISSCAHSPSQTYEIDPAQLDHLLSGEALFGDEANSFVLPDEDIFALTPGMKNFIDRRIPKKASVERRISTLADALLLSTKYVPDRTHTAKEAFENGSANCLGFTILFYSLAKYIGIDAHINEVDIPATWQMEDDSTVVFLRHVNVKIKIQKKIDPSAVNITSLRNKSFRIIDLNMKTYQPFYNQRIISLDTTHAQFYNNRGIELMMANDIKGAFRYLRKAIEIAPELDYAWNNLGALYNQNGLHSEAEIAYLKALSIAPNGITTLNNINRLYSQKGEYEKAQYYDELIKHQRHKNPYYHFFAAKKAFEQNQFNSALISINKAIKYEKKDTQFRDLKKQINEALKQT